MTWVFCSGMIRSGSTVQYQLAATIIESTNCGCRVSYTPESEFIKIRDKYSSGYAVFKAHLCLPDLLGECLNSKAKVLYTYRDIRDVAVSAMRKFEMSFEDLIDKKWLDQAIEDYNIWTAVPDVLVSRYESFRDNLELETRKIADFLQIQLSDQAVAGIAQDFHMDRQKERVAGIRIPCVGSSGQHEVQFDPHELLHWNHIAEGQVGGWRKLLNLDQQSYLTERFHNWLKATGYSLDERA